MLAEALLLPYCSAMLAEGVSTCRVRCSELPVGAGNHLKGTTSSEAKRRHKFMSDAAIEVCVWQVCLANATAAAAISTPHTALHSAAPFIPNY